MRNDLLAESPYLSMDVLINTVLEDILPHAMLYQVLIANPDVSTSPEFTEFLYTESQLPVYMIQSLEAMQDTVTPRTVIEQNLSASSKQRTYAAKAIIRFYQNDSLGNADSVKYYLKNLSTFNSYCQLAEVYFQEGNTTQSTAYYDSLETQFELTSTQQNEVTQFRALNAIRFGLQGEGRGIDSLTIGEVNQLHNIADTSYLMAGAIARAMLRRYQDPYLPEVTLPNPNFTKRSRAFVPWPFEENINAETAIIADETRFYPNPTQGDLFAEITLKAQNGLLTFVDAQGKVVYEKEIQKGTHKITIPTQQWAKGMYFGKVTVAGKIVFEDKVALK